MKRVQNILPDNPLIRNDVDSTQFTMLVEKCIEKDNSLSNVAQIEYVHGLIKYNHWAKDADMFQYLDSDSLNRLRRNEIYFILDASVEGYSPFYQIPFFDAIHYNCEKYNVSPEQIIFVSSNLLDEQNYSKFLVDKNYKSCKVLSFNFFEGVAQIPYQWNNLIENGQDIYDSICLEKIKKDVSVEFLDRYFSSLSRMNRYERSRATFILCQHPVSKHALISHNKLELEGIRKRHFLHNLSYTEEQLDSWLSQLPLVVDRNDFETNWAMDTPFLHIHNKTLFQIVNETYQSNFYNTSIFFSEKTFRPVVCFQPFIIYGQQHCHKKLEEIGYKLYRKHFDYAFDDEQDDLIRYQKILEQVNDLCVKFDSMSRDQKIEWRFQDEEILRHNFNVLRQSKWNLDKITNFLKTQICKT